MLGLIYRPLRAEHVEEVEIAPFMGSLQRFSQKLGYAIEAENDVLSEFYRHELEEVFGDLKAVEEHDGFPVGSTVKKIMDPLMRGLSASMLEKDWLETGVRYNDLIDGCNRCHSALEHEFIEILPAVGDPPYNQKF